MKYESFPNIGSKTNSLIVFYPDDDSKDYDYKTEFPVLEPVNGPLSPDQFNQRNKTLLPPSEEWEFDACSDSHEYRHNSFHGKHRDHAYQLGANYRKQSVAVFKHWLTKESQDSFANLLDILRSLCQGVRCTFSDKDIVWYTVNQGLMDEILMHLIEIHDRTPQLNPY